jgi:CDP-diacylglycerol--glycerol-3-phosphate 3-phosphatidyltransferase
MLASQARPQIQRLLDPLGRKLASSGLSPDVVTVVGTLGVSAAAIGFFTRGSFWIGTLVITSFVFSDLLDGLIARARGVSSKWGAFLDSSSDRVADSAIFGSIAIWYAGDGKSLPLVAAAVYALAMGGIISYVKARAEGLGFDCNTGFAERGERLLIVLVAAFITGLGVSWVLPVALWLLCVATTITVGQRLVYVYKQATADQPRPERPTRRPMGRPAGRVHRRRHAEKTGEVIAR